ncbi:MAG: hypothetical protein JWO90_1929, partial [Solirubrobacterales bacterium]|nr:hypothetical protein [Solirubrobacterales bacterium]
MRRLLTALLVVLLAGGAFVAAGAGSGDDAGGGARYVVELDNAFGLVEGADVKVAGVRAGKIATLDIDTTSDAYRALVGIEITQEGFGELREDVFCESRPQSLIGEYFVDCQPGIKPRRLPRGARIPVEQTGSTVPVDLVNNIMRRPFRERFSIIFNELGAGLAGRAEDLNETIRRANPALRETDRVLAQLAKERRTIADLNRDADVVLRRLADNKRDVGRFVVEARDTQEAYAAEADSLQAQFERLPRFLRELRPTLQVLGRSVDRQRPALANLERSAGDLTRFLDTLGPFSDASRPAVRSLAKAARTGRRTVEGARPTVRRLGRAARQLPEVGTNLAITLEHLDDPRFAVERDPRSPRGGSGFTGLEALLRYVFTQSQTTNLVGANGHLLKVSVFLDNLCAAFTDATLAKEKQRDRCAAVLGPNRPGITSPDPTATAPGAQTRAARRARRA